VAPRLAPLASFQDGENLSTMRQAQFLLLCCLLLAGPLVAASDADAAASEEPPDPRSSELHGVERLDALLAHIRQRQSQLETMEASFVQRKESSMLLEPSEARGVFSYAAPDRVRWEYETPDPISLLIADDEMTTWYRDLEKAEKAFIGRQSQKVLEYLGAGSSLDDLIKYFDVAMAVPGDRSEPFRLEMKPRYARIAKRLTSMKIWIDPALYLPIGLRYVEPDGDVTDYRFMDLRINDLLPDERFELELPGEVEVSVVELEGRSSRR